MLSVFNSSKCSLQMCVCLKGRHDLLSRDCVVFERANPQDFPLWVIFIGRNTIKTEHRLLSVLACTSDSITPIFWSCVSQQVAGKCIALPYPTILSGHTMGGCGTSCKLWIKKYSVPVFFFPRTKTKQTTVICTNRPVAPIQHELTYMFIILSLQWRERVKVAFFSGFLRKIGRTVRSHKA